jgi:hypothetical protein
MCCSRLAPPRLKGHGPVGADDATDAADAAAGRRGVEHDGAAAGDRDATDDV